MSNEIATTTTELHPAWDRARNYLAGVQQALRISIAGQVLVGMELMTIKKDLGFVGNSRPTSPDGQFVHGARTWQEWVSAELGVSYKTADRMILMFDAARARIKKIGHTGDLHGGTQKLALIVDARPATLAPEDRERLAAVVERLTDGATQAELLEELRLVKKPAAPPHTPGGHQRDPEKPVEQLAFNFWLTGGTEITDLRHRGSQYLNLLPLESSDPQKPSLRTLREETAALLADIESAINANLKPTRGRTL